MIRRWLVRHRDRAMRRWLIAKGLADHRWVRSTDAARARRRLRLWDILLDAWTLNGTR